MNHRFHRISTGPVVSALLAMAFASTVFAPATFAEQAEPTAPTAVDFDRDLAPVLRAKCLACHNASTAEGNVVLESVDQMLAGADGAEILVPGSAEDSLVWAVAAREFEPFMPPEENEVGAEPLTEAEILLLRRWIDAGAAPSLREEQGRAEEAIAWQAVPDAYHPALAAAIDDAGVHAVFSRGPRLFVTHAPSRTVVAELADPSLKTATASRDVVQSAAMSADGRWIAAGGFRQVKLWRRAAPTAVDLPDRDAAEAAASHGRSATIDEAAGASVLDGDVNVISRIAADPGAVVRQSHLATQLRVAEAALAHAEGLLQEAADQATAEAELAKTADEELIQAETAETEKQEAADQAAAGVAETEQVITASGAEAEEAEARLAVVKLAAEQVAQTLADSLTQVNEALAPITDMKNEEGADDETDSLASLPASLSRVATEAAERFTAKQAELAEAIAAATARRDEAAGRLEGLKEAAAEATKQRDEAAAARDAAAEKATRARETANRAAAARDAAESRAAELRGFRDERAAAEAEAGQAVEQASAFRQVALAPSGHVLAAIVEGEAPRLHDATSGAFLGEISVEEAESIEFFGDDVLVVASPAGPTAWGVRPRWELVPNGGGSGDAAPLVDRVTALDFSPDGALLAIASGEPSRTGQLQVRRLADGAVVWENAELHSDVIYSVAFSPTGEYLATAAADRNVKILDAASGELRQTLEGHTSHALAVAWRDDGAALVTGGADSALKVWNFFSGRQERTINGPGKEATGVAFTPSGEEIVAAWGDGVVRVYTAADGREARSIGGAGGFLHSAAIAGARDVAVTTTSAGEALLFNPASGEQLGKLPSGE